MKKRLFTWILAVCMLLTLVLAAPMSVAATEEESITVDWNSEGGTLKVHHTNGEISWESDSIALNLEPGQSLTDVGYIFDSISFPDPRDFLGWQVLCWTDLYNGETLVNSDWTRVPGTGLMKTEELMQYKVPEGYDFLIFSAVWGGNSADYYTNFNLDPLGGSLHYSYTTGGEDYLEGTFCFSGKEGDTTIGEAMYESSVVINEVVWEGHSFQGWVMYHWDDNDQLCLASNKVYTMEELLDMELPHDDAVFLAKWEDIDLYDCQALYSGFAVGATSFFPAGATVTEITLDQPVKSAGSELDCFAFTAPESGIYGIYADKYLTYYGSTAPYSEGMYPDGVIRVRLIKGQKLKFYSDAQESITFRVEKLNEITALRVVSQNENYKVLNSDMLYKDYLVNGVVVEATFADGTKKQYALSSDDMSLDGRTLNVRYSRKTDKVDVTLTCEDGTVTYSIKTYAASLVKFEILLEEDQFLYENYDGWFSWTEGYEEFFYYEPDLLLQNTKLRLTWSDGKAEVVEYNDAVGYGGFRLETEDQDQYNTPWTVGKNPLYAYFGELFTKVDITVKENPVASVTLVNIPTTVYYGDPFYFTQSDGGYELKEVINEETAVRVYYTDGTFKDYPVMDIAEEDGLYIDGYYVEIYSWIGDHFFTGPGEGYMRVDYLGFSGAAVIEAISTEGMNGWKLIDDRWAYLEDGVFACNEWVPDGNGMAYIDENGRMVCDMILEEDGGYRYVDENGHLAVDQWIYIESMWSYAGPDGYLVRNTWQKKDGQWAFVDDTYGMVTDQWVPDGDEWCYVGADGYMVTSEWIKDGDRWCYLNKYGYRVTNQWVKDGDRWCYIGADGYMVTNDWAKDSAGWCFMNRYGYITYSKWVYDGIQWSYVNDNGYRVTNKWVKDGSRWCYIGADGYMVTNGWAKDGSAGWCYMNQYGYITYSKWVHDGIEWSYVNADGYMVTNKWQKDGSKWCYIGADGYIVKNKWVKDAGKWCYIGSDGYMVTNGWAKDGTKWCYMNASGYITYNKWVKDGQYWAYVGSDGYMVTGDWIDNGSTWSYVDKYGHALTGTHTIDGKTYTFDANGEMPK